MTEMFVIAPVLDGAADGWDQTGQILKDTASDVLNERGSGWAPRVQARVVSFATHWRIDLDGVATRSGTTADRLRATASVYRGVDAGVEDAFGGPGG